MMTPILPVTPNLGATRSEMMPPTRQPMEPKDAGIQDIQRAIDAEDSPIMLK